jgi:S-formylglutathione hydrolase FrmB
VRRRLPRAIAMVVGLMALGSLVATPAEAEPAGLRLVRTHQVSPRLRELTFRTPALVGETTVRVLLPNGYDPSGRTRYPVLYLLHGGTGSYRDWTDAGDAAAITARDPMIVVMPDASAYGGYVDWYNHGAGGPPMWETFHIGQLLPWIDAHLPTTGTRAGRAVAGLSMGGGGAMGYAARHPDLFAAVAAFSGAVDTNSPYVQPLVEMSGVQDGHLPGSVGGHRLTDEVRWRGRNPWDLAGNLRGLYVELRTGNGFPGGPEGGGDPIEYAVHEQMASLHDRLVVLGIPHTWDDYGAGGHTWPYWKRDLRGFLPNLREVFAHPRPAPARVDHTSIESTYGAFGWQVRVQRPATEFSELVGAAADGFALRGSGSASVTTPGSYRSGQPLLVTVHDARGATTMSRRADEHGRLRVSVVLGPGNPYQQLSPEALAWQLTRAAASPPGHVLDSGLEWPTYTATVTIRAGA